MGIIKILDPLTANQIAAGEVVERPVSVVKELVENSIDAGSTRIKITIWEGGIKRIQVSDNGWGMAPEDLRIAVQRHATSKIERVDDLNRLSTLGFRGEALPSIAAVSKMKVSSRSQESPVGYTINVLDGQPGKILETGCPVGTEVTVDDLFFNTPARKKFLKSPVTELGHISDLIGRLAMSQPSIAFELVHEKKVLFRTPGNGDLAEVVFAVYGGEVARNIIKINHEGYPGISGFVSLPQVTRSSRHYYNFFINGRLVKSQELANCVEETYYTRIPAKRYPIVIVHLTLDQELYDVNVHPAKLEVKFKDISPVKDTLFRTVNSAFSSSIPEIIQKPILRREEPAEQKQIWGQEMFIKDQTNHYLNQEIKQSFDDDKEDDHDEDNKEHYSFHKSSSMTFSSLRVLGQLDGTFIIASGNDGLYIIDQHAAHERIRYEKIKKTYLEQPSAANMLAVPVPIELTHQQSLWLINHIVKLADLGFILEHFGDNTFLLRGVPRWHIEGNSQELLLDILEKLGNDKEYFFEKDFTEEKIFSLACKSSVKANRFLTESDISFLLHNLDLAENPLTCPHGRPVLIKLTYEEIKRRFFRT